MKPYKYKSRPFKPHTPPGSPVLSHRGPHASHNRSAQSASRSETDPQHQVLEYLNKKGYSKTEATLRREVADRDDGARAIVRKVQDKGWERHPESYGAW
jgi:transcription initiation factor TFIID subunit 5